MDDDSRDSLAPAKELPEQTGRIVALMLAGAAVVGLFTGIRQEPPTMTGLTHTGRGGGADGEAIFAPDYRQLTSDAHRRTDERQAASFARLASDRRSPTDPVVVTEEERLAAIAERATNRAYDGAPPRIPHGIDQLGVAGCPACHVEGMRVSGHVASAMSHEELLNCVQCHVTDSPPAEVAMGGLEGGPPLASDFRGLPSPSKGERAAPGAPPTIPHPTRMRERCASCHGVLASGLATTHPARASCTQCHAPSARMDQMPTGGVSPGAFP